MRIDLEDRLQRKHEALGQDCFVAAAIVAGVVGVAGSISSGIASSNAAGAQTNAANNAASIQQQQFEQNQTNQAPFIGAGQNALQTIGQDQTNQTGFATPFNPQTYIDTPGYQFQQQQGANAINSSAAATGGVLNGGTLKALDQYTTGLANSTYSTAYNQYLQNANQQYNQLFGVAQLGEQGAGTLGAQGTQSAAIQGNDIMQAGNATAAGDIGVGNAINSGLSSAGLLGLAANASSQSGYSTPQPNRPTFAPGGSGQVGGNIYP
jgi:hypothetical protein